uniref:TetR/AcrR family transcriptional regulator n=1 Tax=Jiangella endophytica TaxID=1623398 RepID=UPI000E348E2F
MAQYECPLDLSTEVRPLRADARRNQARILEAADEVFAAHGPATSTEQIARRAEVAIGTVFRHFPTKAALVEAVFIDRLRRLTATAAELSAGPDPGAAFFTFVTRWAELSAVKHAFADALARDGVDVAGAAAAGEYVRVRAELTAAVGALLERAQGAGAVRADVGTAELDALLIGAARAVEHTAGHPGVRRRTLTIILDGLRPRDGDAVPGAPTP